MYIFAHKVFHCLERDTWRETGQFQSSVVMLWKLKEQGDSFEGIREGLLTKDKTFELDLEGFLS